jgi:hypothetical protein
MIGQTLALIRNLLLPNTQQTPDLRLVQQVQPLDICLPAAPIHALTGREASRGLTENDRVLMAIKLAGLIRTPVNHLQVLARYRRVFLISFEPWGWIDPVMPLTAVPLGREHDKAYGRLAEWLQAWQSDQDSHHHWYVEARHWATRCAAFAAAGLQMDEGQYYAQELFHSISLPAQRR